MSHTAWHYNNKFVKDVLGRDIVMMRGSCDMEKVHDTTGNVRDLFSGDMGQLTGTPGWKKRKMDDTLAIMKHYNMNVDYWNTMTQNPWAREIRQNMPKLGKNPDKMSVQTMLKLLGDVFNRLRHEVMNPAHNDTRAIS